MSYCYSFAMNQAILFLVAVTFVSTCDSNDDVEKIFSSSQLNKDLNSANPPKELQVKYKTSNKEVKLGNELTPKDVQEHPEVHFEADPASFYTLILTDPDAPSRKNPANREYQHWTVVNIPGSDVSKGETVVEYLGSAPPKDTGLHRYVFLVFKQTEKMAFREDHKNASNKIRGHFSTAKFAKKYNLGHPIAGNFFQARFEEVHDTQKKS